MDMKMISPHIERFYWKMSWSVHIFLQNFHMVPKINALSRRYLDCLGYLSLFSIFYAQIVLWRLPYCPSRHFRKKSGQVICKPLNLNVRVVCSCGAIYSTCIIIYMYEYVLDIDAVIMGNNSSMDLRSFW